MSVGLKIAYSIEFELGPNIS